MMAYDLTLAIDTVGGRCATALVGRDGSVLAEQVSDMARGHAEALIPQIDSCLAAAACQYADIERLAVTTGPGSFTSVRVGLSVARALALALDVPVFGVSSLKLAATQAPSDQPCLVMLSGRGKSIFWEYFAAGDSGQPGAVPERATLAGPGNEDEDQIRARYPVAAICIDPIISPVVLGQLVQQLSDTKDWPAEPHYLRSPDAAPANPLFSVRAIDD